MKVTKTQKLAYLVIGVICLMLGVIGLIIPIIPGILFLMAAIYLLSQGSARIRHFVRANPRFEQMHQRMDRMSEVDFASRMRVTGWMAVDATVSGAQYVGSRISGVCAAVKRRSL